MVFPIRTPGGFAGRPSPIAPRDTISACPCIGSHRIHHHTDVTHSPPHAMASAVNPQRATTISRPATLPLRMLVLPPPHPPGFASGFTFGLGSP